MQKRPNRSKRKQRGFTLVEVFIALVVFATVIAGVFHILQQSFATAESALNLNRVTQILQYRIENIRGTKWEDLNLNMGNKTIPVSEEGIPGVSSANLPYDWQAFNLVEHINPTGPSTYKVTLTATWTDRRGHEQTQEFQTTLTENGLNAYYTRSI